MIDRIEVLSSGSSIYNAASVDLLKQPSCKRPSKLDHTIRSLIDSNPALPRILI
jgi:hypothetical protein